jgi:branched-subunit amino acid aminotransferase/4-amino-4-deoxychorismate lyase
MNATSEERVLRLQDLESADGVFLCNAVRGIRPVKSLCLDTSFRREAVAFFSTVNYKLLSEEGGLHLTHLKVDCHFDDRPDPNRA